MKPFARVPEPCAICPETRLLNYTVMITSLKSWPLWSLLALLLAGCSHTPPVVQHHYTTVANGSRQYIFVFDRHLLVPHRAALLDASGQVVQPFTDSLEALPMAVQAATFYKDSALLLTLDDGSLLQYVLPSKTIRYFPPLTDTATRDDAFLLDPSTAVGLSTQSFDGLNFRGNDLVSTNLLTGEVCLVAKDIARCYRQGDSLFYTRDFSQLFFLDRNGSSRKLLQTPDSVSLLTGNGGHAAFITWKRLSRVIRNAYQAAEADHLNAAQRISRAASATNPRYAQKYALEILDNKTGKTLLCDSFPQEGFDIRALRFTDAAHLLVEERSRDTPVVKRTVVISLADQQQHVLPANSTVLDATADYLVLLHNELAVYDLHTYQLRPVGAFTDSTASLVNSSCCGVYYFSISAPGGSSSVQALEVKEGSIREVKRLRW